MPQSNNDQTGSASNQANQAIEKRGPQLEDTQQANQDSRLREQAFDSTRSETREQSQEKRKRMDISL